MSEQQKEEKPCQIERYLLFVGCAIPECENEHSHPHGWECLAAGADDLDSIRREVLQIPDHLWWHVVDVQAQRIIMRSTEAEAPRH